VKRCAAGRAAVNDAHHHVNSQMHVHAQFDRFDFARAGSGTAAMAVEIAVGLFFAYFLFASFIHRASGVADFSHLTTPC